MASELLDTRAACPNCGAAVRTGAPWCTQCFHDLRPAPAPAPTPPAAPRADLTVPATAAYGLPAVDPLTAPLTAAGEESEDATHEPVRTWPCTACETPNTYDRDDCVACGKGFLAGMHEGDTALVIPGIGDLSTMGRGRAMGVAFAAIGVVMLLVLVFGILVG